MTDPLHLHIDPQSNLPLFAQLRQQITWLIASGNLKPGDRLPTIRDLADRLGVHMHTIRQAYHSLEEDALVETRPSRGTHVRSFDLNSLIAAESAAPSHTIGVLIPGVLSFYEPFIAGVEEIARHSGYMVIISFTHDREELTIQSAQQLAAKGVDGILAASPTKRMFANGFPSESLPIVYVDAPGFPTPSILLDLEKAGFLATEHLIHHGHQRIAMITAPLTWPNFKQAHKGYQRAFAASHLELESELVLETPNFSVESGYQAAEHLLDMNEPPRAIFVSGDLMTAGLMRAFKENGRRIPEDFAVVSKDNIELAALMDPPLTTVALPAYQMGIEAMNMLLDLIIGKRLARKRVTLGVELIVRRSCGCKA